MFAWLLLGGERGTLDREADYVEELLDMSGFYALTLSDRDRARGQQLFDEMRDATPNGECKVSGSAL